MRWAINSHLRRCTIAIVDKGARERRLAYGREYYASHKGEYRRRYRERREENREYARERWVVMREVWLTQQKAYKRAHRTERNEYDRGYYRRHKDDRRIRNATRRASSRSGSLTPEEWQEVLSQHSGRCALCGTTENITMDHIIPLSKGGKTIRSNVQPLCKRCNSSKGDK